MTFTKEQLQNLIEFNSSDSDGQANAESWEVHKLARMALAGMESVPVAYMHRSGQVVTREECCDDKTFAICCKVETPLYAAPQPLTTSERAELENYRNAQQVVPDVMDDAGGVCCEVSYADGWNACRSAMQGKSDGTLANEGTIPTTQFKPVADLYGLTPPTCGETSFTFDAVEARDFISGGYSVQEYVELERYQKAVAGNSPVTPDGWVACSERMPEDEQEVIVQNKMGYRYVSYFDEHSGLFFDMRGGNQMNCIEHIFVTHWMPLPNPPKE